MRLDSELRVQGVNGGGMLAVRYRGGEAVCTAFMGNDFYYSPENAADADWAKSRIGEALDHAEQAEAAAQ